MNVVRNIIMVISAGGVAFSAGLFGLLVVSQDSQHSGSTPPTPANSTFAGYQLAFGGPNNTAPPAGTTTPTTPSEVLASYQNFQSNLPADYINNYALLSASLLQAFIDDQRGNAGVPALAYDPVLGLVAANLIADTVTTGLPFPRQGGINSLMQTPIVQVTTQFPLSTVTYVSAFIVVTDVNNTSNATIPQQGLLATEKALLADPNGIMLNAGWTHYGFAVETAPAVPGVSNARQYYVIFFAKEN